MTSNKNSFRTSSQLQKLKPNPDGSRREVADELSSLRVRVSKRKVNFVWYVTDKKTKKRSVITIGEYPALSLADARKELETLQRTRNNQGALPSDLTVEQVVCQYLGIESAEDFEGALQSEQLVRKGKRLRAPEKVVRSMLGDIVPAIGQVRARQITGAQVVQMVENIKARGAEPARLALLYANRVFAWGVARSLMHSNPAAEVTAGVMGVARTDDQQRHRVPRRGEVAALLQLLDDDERCRLDERTRLAIKILLYMGIRTGELIGAKWSEVHFPRQLWTAPGERRKSGKPVTYPLPDALLTLFQALYKLTGEGEGKHEEILGGLDRRAIGRALTRLQQPRGKERVVLWNTGSEHIAPHDFRRCFRTNCKGLRLAELDVIRFQMGHSIGNAVDSTYDRAQLLGQRKALLTAWAECLANPALRLLSDSDLEHGIAEQTTESSVVVEA